MVKKTLGGSVIMSVEVKRKKNLVRVLCHNTHVVVHPWHVHDVVKYKTLITCLVHIFNSMLSSFRGLS